MNLGSISELILKRSVIKHIRKNNKEVKYGSAIGHDFGVFNDVVIAHGISENVNEENENTEILKSDRPKADLPFKIIGSSEIAYIRAMNNLYTSKAKPGAIHVVFILPENAAEEQIKYEMARLNDLCDKDEVQILGGHTEISTAVKEIIVSITAYGRLACDKEQCDEKHGDEEQVDKERRILPDDCLVIAGYTGIMGETFLAERKFNELSKRFSESYIKKAIHNIDEFCIKKAATIAWNNGALLMHDVSTGGIYAAISQIADETKLGIKVEHKQIPIHQETIEICEYFNLNPYVLMGTGALVIACDKENADNMVLELRKAGIEASVAGFFTKEKEKIIVAKAEDVKRHLLPANGDELYKIFS